MAPYPSDEVTPAVDMFFLAYKGLLSKNNNIKNLDICGNFNLALLSPDLGSCCFQGIQTLNIDTMQLIDGKHKNQEAVEKFLNAFPNLVQLSVRFRSNYRFYKLGNLSDWPFQDMFLE
jgi:hypothetical protein